MSCRGNKSYYVIQKHLRMHELGQAVIVQYQATKTIIPITLKSNDIKEINAPECIVELYKHAGIFKNTREVHKELALLECS